MSPPLTAKNVGTNGHPVTGYHQYAVGMLYQEINSRRGAVRVLTIDGSLTDDLKKGVVRAIIPDDLTGVWGMVPDLLLQDKEGRPVRFIEVITTSEPSQDKRQKLARLQGRGVETVMVYARNLDDMKQLIHVEIDRPHQVSTGGLYTDAHMRRLDREAQNQSDEWVRSMVLSLQRCAPDLRRQVLELLKELDELESLWPLDQDNPVRASFDEKAKAP